MSSVKQPATRAAAPGVTPTAPAIAFGRTKSVLLNVVSLAVFLLLWQIAAALYESPFFPGPMEIGRAFVHLAQAGDTQGTSLFVHSWTSLYRVLLGFAAGVVLGVPMGLAMGLYRRFYAATRAVVEPFRFIPPIAWIPLAIIFFSGTTRFVFLIFIGAFFPVFTSTLVGVSRVEQVHRKVALVYGASKLYVLTHIVFPTVLPDILAGMRVAMGADVWLRSAEANVQLEGQVRVSKAGRTYRPTGTLNAPRGSYTLKIGPVSRDFTVTRGEVQYFGDLNAGLNIQARHTVRAVRGEEIPVIANIQGTLQRPRLTLESTFRPPISETDLVSYLITGYPANEATLIGQGSALQTGLGYFSSALSSELERALIQDIGVPIDLIEIRPGVSSGPAGTGSLTQLAAGWQIGRKTFLTFNAGFCPDFSQLSYRNLGASLEFRFSREWRLQSSVEPTIRSCSSLARIPGLTSENPYQIGFDILWEREF